MIGQALRNCDHTASPQLCYYVLAQVAGLHASACTLMRVDYNLCLSVGRQESFSACSLPLSVFRWLAAG